jgi:tripartite-type tricarboxylate transporter receptor subunit TctC
MKRFTIARLFGALALTASAFCLPTSAGAQAWPTKNIRIVLQFPPGGSTDVVARILAQALTAKLGQTVIVENKPGADGAIAAEFVLRSEPDGHTYFLASNTPMMQVPLLKKNPPYDPVNSFTPISLVGRYIYVLVTNPNVPAKTAAELISYAKANPGKLNYGSYSSVTQLMYSSIRDQAKVDMNVVNYKGEGPTVNDILGGHIQLTFSTPTSTLAHVKDGKLRALAILLPERVPYMPDVPTVAEAGLPPLKPATFAALYGPAKVPPEIAKKMSDALKEVMSSPEIREKVEKQGLKLEGSTPEWLGNFTKEQLGIWRQAFDEAGMKPE